MLTQRLPPGTLYRFRFECPWRYFLILRYGETNDVPPGFPKLSIIFLSSQYGIKEMPLFRFESMFKEFDGDIEIIQCA